MGATYLVTGANRGTGLELVRQLVERGGDVITCRVPDAATELRALPADVEPLDLVSAYSIEALADGCRTRQSTC